MSLKEDELRKILNFFYELGQLKRTPRSGWWYIGIKNPETVAEHSIRAMYIAFILAKIEGADPAKAALISAFHDLPETRINDLHKIAQKYFPNKRDVEKKIIKDQLSLLPKDITLAFEEILTDFETDSTPEQIIAKDADYLECAIQAKEYIDQGYSAAQNWIDNTKKGCLVTETAKKFLEIIEKSNSEDWYPKLKNIKR